MKIVSWNVNGIRACWESSLRDYLRQAEPDVITFQEVKSHTENLPQEICQPEGYKAFWHSGERAGYSGVGALVKEGLEPVWALKGMGIPEIDAEGRVLTLEFEDFFLIGAYFPNSGAGAKRLDYKLRFCRKMELFCSNLLRRDKAVLLAGDFNVAPQDIDLHDPEENRGHPGTLSQEREWMLSFLDSGDWVDVFRRDHPEGGHYSWWSFFDEDRKHDRGWRIDHLVTNKDFADRVKVSLDKTVMGSDHCPLVAEVSL